MDTVTRQCMFTCMRGHKRVYRIYCELELNLRIKPRKRLKRDKPDALAVPDAPNVTWSMDFMADRLGDGAVLSTSTLSFHRGLRQFGSVRHAEVLPLLRRIFFCLHPQPYPKHLMTEGGSSQDEAALCLRTMSGHALKYPCALTGGTLVKALARAIRWKRMLESGHFATIAELAAREGIAHSYMTRVLRLTLLAPDIVEAILEGRQGLEVTLARLMEPFPVEWAEQLEHLR